MGARQRTELKIVKVCAQFYNDLAEPWVKVLKYVLEHKLQESIFLLCLFINMLSYVNCYQEQPMQFMAILWVL